MVVKFLALFPAILLLCGCQSSVTDADRSLQFLSAVDEPHVPKDTAVASRLTSDQALKIASDLTTEHKEEMENYGPARVTFYPKSQHWVVFFQNKRPYKYGKPDTYRNIGVLIDDNTGEAAYNADNHAVWRAISDRISAARGFTNFPAATTPDDGQYKKAALKLLIQEANRIAEQLNLPEHLPIEESNLVEKFILPFAGAQSWKAIGTIKTRDYSYAVSKENKFCFLTKLHQEEDRDRWQAGYSWPISRRDTNAAYQLATQWLATVGMDVNGLNRDCRLHIYAAGPEGVGRRARFVPLYSVYWVVKGLEGRGSAASVQMFLPTKTLVQLRVDDPQYNLRTPLVVTNVDSFLSQTNATTQSKPLLSK